MASIGIHGGGSSAASSTVFTIEDGLALQFDGSADPILYLGQAAPGSATSAAAWRIIQIDVTTGVAMTWADGNDSFDNIWDNRAALSYS